MFPSKKVARILEKGLDVARVAIVMKGIRINHAHTKLFPLHGVKEKFKEIWIKEKIFRVLIF